LPQRLDRASGRRGVYASRSCQFGQETFVPKSKVRKKPDAPVRLSATASTGRQLAPSPAWYPIVMAVLLVLGLAWLVTYYLAPNTPLISDLGAWNFAVGFGIMLLGLSMAVRWR